MNGNSCWGRKLPVTVHCSYVAIYRQNLIDGKPPLICLTSFQQNFRILPKLEYCPIYYIKCHLYVLPFQWKELNLTNSRRFTSPVNFIARESISDTLSSNSLKIASKSRCSAGEITSLKEDIIGKWKGRSGSSEKRRDQLIGCQLRKVFKKEHLQQGFY